MVEKFIDIKLDNIKEFIQENQTTLSLNFGQSIKLKYDETSQMNYRIFVNGVLNISDVTEGDSSFYIITYSENLANWCNYSSFLAGEIIIESLNFSCKLAIVIKAEEDLEKSILTIINPDSCDVIIDSGDILEFVIFEEGIDDKINLFFEFTPSENLDISFEPMGHTDFVINLWSPTIFDFSNNYYATFPRVVLEKDSYCSQHHFWFRLNEKILEYAKKKTGLCYIGNFSFSFDSEFFNCSSYKNCAIYVDFDKIDIKKLENSFSLPSKDEFENQLARTMNKNYLENNNMNHELQVFDISLSLIDSKNFEDGCNTLPSNQKSIESKPIHRTGGFSRMLSRKPYFKYFD